MSVDFKIYDQAGNLVFDINKHRLIRFLKTEIITAAQWKQTSTAAIWTCDYPGVSPSTHMSTSPNITVLTDKLQFYNQYSNLTTNPGNQSVELYGI